MSAILQGKGDVYGPIVAVSENIPVFDGTSGKIIKDGGASLSTVMLPLAGSIIQTFGPYLKTDSNGTGQIIPNDGTIPQSNEGTQIASSGAITLRYANSRILWRGSYSIILNTTSIVAQFALFRNSDVSAFFYRRIQQPNQNHMQIVDFDCFDAPGTIGPHTYTMKAGISSGLLPFGHSNTTEYGTLTGFEIKT